MGPQIPEAYRKKYQLEKKDSGVDGLILQEGGSSVAYQVKFRSAQAAPSYDELTSFWAESEHTDGRCIFANCYALPKQSQKKKDQFTILRDCLSALERAFLRVVVPLCRDRGRYCPQREALAPAAPAQNHEEVLTGFCGGDRGKRWPPAEPARL